MTHGSLVTITQWIKKRTLHRSLIMTSFIVLVQLTWMLKNKQEETSFVDSIITSSPTPQFPVVTDKKRLPCPVPLAWHTSSQTVLASCAQTNIANRKYLPNMLTNSLTYYTMSWLGQPTVNMCLCVCNEYNFKKGWKGHRDTPKYVL